MDSELKIVGKRRIEGFRRSSVWAKDQIVYFVAEFSEPFGSHMIVNGIDITEQNERTLAGKGTNLTASFRFANPKNKQILVKVALSPVSIEGARKNLAAEIPAWNFEKVRADAKAKWNKELSKIEVSGGTEDQLKTFYTALYHTNIAAEYFSGR